eukprot:scaffold5576_cov115-Pinguiococcus_pyrenoidosus.AAC.1
MHQQRQSGEDRLRRDQLPGPRRGRAGVGAGLDELAAEPSDAAGAGRSGEAASRSARGLPSRLGCGSDGG